MTTKTISKKENKLEKISKRIFFQLLLDSQNIILEDMNILKSSYLKYVQIENDVKTYLTLGFKIKYFKSIDGTISYKMYEPKKTKKIGFKIQNEK